MNINFRSYRSEDLLKVRHFLIQSYSKLKTPNTWLIDRWEFVVFFRRREVERWSNGNKKWAYGSMRMESLQL